MSFNRYLVFVHIWSLLALINSFTDGRTTAPENPMEPSLVTDMPSTQANCSDKEPEDLVPKWSDVYELRDDLLSRIEVDLRPREIQVDKVDMNIQFILNNILKLDDTTQLLTVRGYFHVQWKDDFLQWNQCERAGITQLKIPVKKVWSPKLVILEGVDGTDQLYDPADSIVVNPEGNVVWLPEGDFSFYCDFSIKLYPFDKQTCSMTAYASVEGIKGLEFQLFNGGANVSSQDFKENTEWELISLYAKKEERYGMSMVEITFVMKRRPMFIIYTTMLPLGLLTVLNICILLVPVESGEKCSMAVTLFMAYGVILTFISNGLPHNALDVSHFVLYAIWLLAYSVVTVAYTVIQSRVYTYYGEREVRALFRASSFVKRISPKSIQLDDANGPNGDAEKISEDEILTWKKLFRKLDVILFAVCLIFHVIISVILFDAIRKEASQ